MENTELEKLKYPNGKFSFPSSLTASEIEECIKAIKQLPHQIKEAVNGLSEAQLQNTYRPEGWNIKQLLNHLIDSHTNSVIRFKLALTEETPTIRPYDENAWVLLGDTENCPLELSLNLLENLHARWVILLQSMQTKDWERKLFHPVSKREFNLMQFLALYAWHGKHHLAHIELAKRNNK